MRRITIRSGPAKFRILAIVGLISITLNGTLFFTHSTILADLYSRKGACAPFNQLPFVRSARSLVFRRPLKENGIKPGDPSLIRK
jgi:hypothetical protein